MHKVGQIILVYENGLDLKYISNDLEANKLSPVFADSKESFIEYCNNKVYDLILINDIRGKEGILLIEEIGITKNHDTPVLMLIDTDTINDLNKVFPINVFLISFPLNTRELIIRTRNILKANNAVQLLQDRLKHFNLIIESLPFAIATTDSRGNISNYNRLFSELTGRNISANADRNFFSLFHPHDYITVRRSLDRLLRKDEESARLEIRLMNADGNILPCKITANVLWDSLMNFQNFLFVIETNK